MVDEVNFSYFMLKPKNKNYGKILFIIDTNDINIHNGFRIIRSWSELYGINYDKGNYFYLSKHYTLYDRIQLTKEEFFVEVLCLKMNS